MIEQAAFRLAVASKATGSSGHFTDHLFALLFTDVLVSALVSKEALARQVRDADHILVDDVLFGVYVGAALARTRCPVCTWRHAL